MGGDVVWLKTIALLLAALAVVEVWKGLQPTVLQFDRPVVVTIKYAEAVR
jgi:hypothetical protein